MPKFYLLLVFAITTIRVQAQTSLYHEFPDSNAIWNVTTQGCCWTGCAGPPTPNPIIADSWFSYYIEGDTVINSTTYRKLYQSGSTHEHCAYGNSVNLWYYYDNYVTAFREDTALRIVYFVSPLATNEMIWFDFNAGVGDTISPWDPCTEVASIDSVLVGSTYRKRFHLTNISTYSIIEGIGSTAGLMEPVCPFEYSGVLNCFSQEGQTLYPDTVTMCDLITSQNLQDGQLVEFTVFPNPASDNVRINSAYQLQNATLTIYNNLGEAVLEIPSLYGNTVNCDVSKLDNGVYFFQISENGRILGAGRVVSMN